MAARQKATAVATTDLADVDFESYAGAGLESADAESFAIPFLKVLQTNSPEVDEADSKYVPEAKPGMLINTVTGELFDGKDGVGFVPCEYQRKLLRWAPRGSTQGFRGEVTEAEKARLYESGVLVDHEGRTYFVTEDGKVDAKKCDRLVDTRLHFGLTLDGDDIPHQVLLSLSSTQIKKSKLFNSLIKQQLLPTGKQLPAFANVYRITTAKESNDQGSWFGVNFAVIGRVPNAAVFKTAAEFYESVRGNKVKVDLAGATHERESNAED